MPAFSPVAEERLREILARVPDPRGALLPVLWLAQGEFGTITPGVMGYVAARLGLPESQVRDAATFYTMFRLREDLGRYWIQVCAALPCEIAGCGGILDALRSILKIDVGETTPDGLFTLQKVECLADCDRAPVLRVDDRPHRDLTPDRVRALIEDLRAVSRT